VLDDVFLNSNTMPTCPAAPPPGGLLHVTVSCDPVQAATVAALVPVEADELAADDEAPDDADELEVDAALDEPPDAVALPLPLPVVLDVQAVRAATTRAATVATPINRRILTGFTR
jgi:hypothetical protein